MVPLGNQLYIMVKFIIKMTNNDMLVIDGHFTCVRIDRDQLNTAFLMEKTLIKT